MKNFGLIGYRLGHSFSKNYFSEKFKKLGLDDHTYDLYELESIEQFPPLWEKNKHLVGLNVTVPYKELVLQFIDKLDYSGEKVGAVNTIKKEGSNLVGYNTDYYGFKVSLQNFLLAKPEVNTALVLGSGGASKAVEAVLKELGIEYTIVSRSTKNENITYLDLHKDLSIIQKTDLIVNTTPVGMSPQIELAPDLPFQALSSNHQIYDLVYNPSETKLMLEAQKQGASVKNGLEMLHLQADKAWEIWSS